MTRFVFQISQRNGNDTVGVWLSTEYHYSHGDVASKSLKKDHGVLSDKDALDHAMKNIDDLAHHEQVKVSCDPHPAAHFLLPGFSPET